MTEQTDAALIRELDSEAFIAGRHSSAGRAMTRAAARIEALSHNNRVLTDALWKSCGDDEACVNTTIESQGELK